MKALTFLGTGKYKEVTYVWQEEKAVQTYLFPEAVAHIFEPEKLLVFVTETAKNKQPCSSKHSAHNQTTPRPEKEKTYLEVLQDRLGAIVEPVDIPEGRSEAELWEIFDRVASTVNEGDKIVLDITHAFRSIPMLVLTIAAYLRRTKGVTVEHIVYGAYEARKPFKDPPDPEDRAPIFDLTPLLDLLDWLSGAEILLKQGDGRSLGQKLVEIHQRLRHQGGDMLPEKLKTLGNLLSTFSQDLWLNRPLQAMQKADILVNSLKEAAHEVSQWAKPFGVILEQVSSELSQLSYYEPKTLNIENLLKQREFIYYCLQKGLIVQAVTYAREWVVNWTILQHQVGEWLSLNTRKEVESALGAAVAKKQGETAKVPEWFEYIPHSTEATELWRELTQLRNDLAHCGMTPSAASAESIQRRAAKIPEYLGILIEEVPRSIL